MCRIRLAAMLSVVGSVLLAASCADQTVAPSEEVVVPFAISDARRTGLAAALRFAMRDEALSALADRDAAARISASLANLTHRVDANDRGGALRAVHAARSELRWYRERAPSDANGLLAIEGLSLALDHAELLAAVMPPALYSEEEAFD